MTWQPVFITPKEKREMVEDCKKNKCGLDVYTKLADEIIHLFHPNKEQLSLEEQDKLDNLKHKIADIVNIFVVDKLTMK